MESSHSRATGFRLGKKAGERLARWGSTFLVGLGGLFILFPIAWMLSTSLKPGGNVFLLPIRWIPRRIVWSNYPEALEFMRWKTVFGNSIYVGVMTVLGTVLSSAITAYPLPACRRQARTSSFSW